VGGAVRAGEFGSGHVRADLARPLPMQVLALHARFEVTRQTGAGLGDQIRGAPVPDAGGPIQAGRRQHGRHTPVGVEGTGHTSVQGLTAETRLADVRLPSGSGRQREPAT